jgi:predicted transcriptional regulator
MEQVKADEDLWAAVEKMDRDGVNQLPVMTDSQVLGIVQREDIISYLRTMLNLEDRNILRNRPEPFKE